MTLISLDKPPPLWLASNWGLEDIVSALASVEGAFPDMPALDGTTAFDVALGRGHLGIIKILLDSPAIEPKERMRQMAESLLATEGEDSDEQELRRAVASSVSLNNNFVQIKEDKMTRYINSFFAFL